MLLLCMRLFVFLEMLTRLAFRSLSQQNYEDDYNSYDYEPVFDLFVEWSYAIFSFFIKILGRCHEFFCLIFFTLLVTLHSPWLLQGIATLEKELFWIYHHSLHILCQLDFRVCQSKFRHSNAQTVHSSCWPQIIYIYLWKAQRTIIFLSHPQPCSFFIGHFYFRQQVDLWWFVFPIITNSRIIMSIFHNKFRQSHSFSHFRSFSLFQSKGRWQFRFRWNNTIFFIVFLNGLTVDFWVGSKKKEICEPDFNNSKIDLARVSHIFVLVVNWPAPFQIGFLAF